MANHTPNCPTCGARGERDVDADSYFCRKCDAWIEKLCEEVGCRFCALRAERPSKSPRRQSYMPITMSYMVCSEHREDIEKCQKPITSLGTRMFACGDTAVIVQLDAGFFWFRPIDRRGNARKRLHERPGTYALG